MLVHDGADIDGEECGLQGMIGIGYILSHDDSIDFRFRCTTLHTESTDYLMTQGHAMHKGETDTRRPLSAFN